MVVLGNHDAATIGRPVDFLSQNAQAVVSWTRAQLGEKQRAFLAALPLTVKDDNQARRSVAGRTYYNIANCREGDP